MAVIDVNLAQSIIDDMAVSLQGVVAQALEKQATEFAQRNRHGREESKGHDQVQKEVGRLEAKIQKMKEEKLDVEKERVRLEERMRDAHNTEMDELKRQLEAEKSMSTKREQDMVADIDKLREMVAPLEVWARVILPDASSASNKKASAASSAENKKVVNRAAAWRVDGKHCICTTGAAINNAVPKKKRGLNNNTNSSTSFKYERVFGPTSTNSDVYDALSVHVPRGIESKHLIIIMYGRSGTGKSRTLMKSYNPPKSAGKNSSQPPLIETVIGNAFERACERFDGVYAQITCLEYRGDRFYDLGAEKGVHQKKAIAMEFLPISGFFKYADKAGRQDPILHNVTSAKEAVSYIQASDNRRESSKTDENESSSRGHSWYEVRMCGSSKKKGEDVQEHNMDEDADLGVYTFFDLGGLEQLQTVSKGDAKKEHRVKKESSSLTMALTALNTPFRAIAARETDWEAPDKNLVRTSLCIPTSFSFTPFLVDFQADLTI
jgi:hypothetical protein